MKHVTVAAVQMYCNRSREENLASGKFRGGGKTGQGSGRGRRTDYIASGIIRDMVFLPGKELRFLSAGNIPG